MRALSHPAVGSFLNTHFVSTYQKVGTFGMYQWIKTGGNVASYFTTANGSVLHAVAGTVDGPTFLREARWAVDVMKHAQLKKADATPAKLKEFFRTAHLERLVREHRGDLKAFKVPPPGPVDEKVLANALQAFRMQGAAHNKQGAVHLLLASYPLVPLDRVYGVVFEGILRQPLSMAPSGAG